VCVKCGPPSVSTVSVFQRRRCWVSVAAKPTTRVHPRERETLTGNAVHVSECVTPQDAVELLCRTPQYTQLSALFRCITNSRPSVQLRALQVIQLLCRTYLCKWALCHVGLKAMEAVLRDQATAPDTLAACLTTLGLMVAGVKDAKAQLVERGMPETVMRLAVHDSAEVRLTMLKVVAELCNDSVLFALEVERIGGVNALHILVPKPERDPSTAPPDSTGDAASRATTPRGATPPPPKTSATAAKGADGETVVDEWADVAPDGKFEGEVGTTLIHEAFAADGVELPNAVAGGGLPTKSAKKKQRAAPPALKAARVTHLPMPKTCVEVEAAVPLLFSTVGTLLQQPALRHSLLNKAEEFGYEPAWLSILCFHLEFYEPPPPEPEPEEEPELDPKAKAKAEAEAKKAAKNAPPPPEPEPEAAAAEELTEDGKLKAQPRMQGGELAADITVTAMVALQQMLEEVSTVEALLAEPEERYLCGYDFLDNLLKHMEAGNPRVVEAAVGVIQRLLQVGGEAAAAACEAAGVKGTLRTVARQYVGQRTPLSSSVGECLLAWSLNDTVPPHRPPTPPIPSPPVSPRLPTWREQPLRARVTAAYAARHPEESEDDDSDDGGSPKKGGRRKK